MLCAAHSFSYSAQMHCSGCGAEAGVGRARWLDVRQRASPPGDTARDRLAGRRGPRGDATPSAGAAGRWEHRACPRSPRRAFSRRSMGCFSRPSVARVLRCRKGSDFAEVQRARLCFCCPCFWCHSQQIIAKLSLVALLPVFFYEFLALALTFRSI